MSKGTNPWVFLPLVAFVALAVLLEDMGETVEARRLYEEVIEGRTAQLGASHTTTLTSMYNLAVLLEVVGDEVALKPLLRRLVEGSAATRGAQHAKTVEVRDWLAELA